VMGAANLDEGQNLAQALTEKGLQPLSVRCQVVGPSPVRWPDPSPPAGGSRTPVLVCDLNPYTQESGEALESLRQQILDSNLVSAPVLIYVPR
jgi:hypothetical protein